MLYYSHSKLGSFEQCALKFRFRYIDRVKVDVPETIEQFMGSRVHESLQFLYERVMQGDVPSMDDVMMVLAKSWHGKWSDKMLIVKNDAVYYKDLAAKMVSAYYAQHAPFNGSATVAVEQKFDMEIDDGIKVTGYIDRISANGKAYEVHDYKTSSFLPEQDHLDRDRQLGFYNLAVNKLFSPSSVKLFWHYLAHGKEMMSARTDFQLQRLRLDTAKLVLQIERTEEFLPNVTKLCSWCEYKSICPAFAPKKLSGTLRDFM